MTNLNGRSAANSLRAHIKEPTTYAQQIADELVEYLNEWHSLPETWITPWTRRFINGTPMLRKSFRRSRISRRHLLTLALASFITRRSDLERRNEKASVSRAMDSHRYGDRGRNPARHSLHGKTLREEGRPPLSVQLRKERRRHANVRGFRENESSGHTSRILVQPLRNMRRHHALCNGRRRSVASRPRNQVEANDRRKDVPPFDATTGRKARQTMCRLRSDVRRRLIRHPLRERG